MNFITVDETKKHARIDIDDDDELLESYCGAAEEAVMNACNRTYEDVIDKYGCVPQSLRVAAMMIAAHLYNNREPATPLEFHAIPYTIDALIKPYVIL